MRSGIYYHCACSLRDAILVPSLKRFCVDGRTNYVRTLIFLITEKKTRFSTLSGYVWTSHSFIGMLLMYIFNTITVPFLG